jgi:hypothetical protein
MPDLNFDLSFIVFDLAMRLVCIVAGIATAAHYHCMANFVTRAPHLCKLFVLPGITGSAVGLVYAGFVGDPFWMLVFSVCGLSLLTTMNLIVWKSGAHVSKHLARQKK